MRSALFNDDDRGPDCNNHLSSPGEPLLEKCLYHRRQLLPHIGVSDFLQYFRLSRIRVDRRGQGPYLLSRGHGQSQLADHFPGMTGDNRPNLSKGSEARSP